MTTMSERDLLLPTHASSSVQELEQEFRDGNNNKPDPGSRYHRWQTNLGEFLESPGLHKTVLTLIIIDACCVLADLSYSFLSSTCSPPGEEGSPTWLLVLSHISLFITTLFLIEIPLSLWAFGLHYVNPFGPVPHSALHIFDILVILTTFSAEVVLRGKEREIAGLLIFLRLWRLVKLVGGVAVGAAEIQEETAEELAKTKVELALAKARLAQLQEENSWLKQELRQFTQNERQSFG